MKSILPGRLCYAVCIIGLGVQTFVNGSFLPVLLPNWPAWMARSLFFIYGSASLLVISGVLLLYALKVRQVSLLLGCWFLFFFLAMHAGYLLFVGPYSARHFGLWTDALKLLGLSGGAFILTGKRNLEITGAIFLSVMLLVFGADHFLYTATVQSMVPPWLGMPVVWTYIAAIALIGSGVAILLRIQLRIIGLLLATMLFLWLILLHLPRAIANPNAYNGNEITSAIEALGLGGIALMIAVKSTTNENQD